MWGAASFDELVARLERDYGARLEGFGARLTLAKTATEIRMDLVMVGQPKPVLSKWVPYARRLGWASGAVEPFREPADVETELRGEVDRWVTVRGAP